MVLLVFIFLPMAEIEAFFYNMLRLELLYIEMYITSSSAEMLLTTYQETYSIIYILNYSFPQPHHRQSVHVWAE